MVFRVETKILYPDKTVPTWTVKKSGTESYNLTQV